MVGSSISSALVLFLAIIGSVHAAPALVERAAESHKVTFVNRCGSGTPVFQYAGNRVAAGARKIKDPITSGAAYLDGYKECTTDATNCVKVEFTLINPGTDPKNSMSSVNYSLLTGPGLGNHQFTQKTQIEYSSSKCPRVGACLGNSAALCPHSYRGSDTNSGPPAQCTEKNLGVTITFC